MPPELDEPLAAGPDPGPDDERVAFLRGALIPWFARHQRELPWRETDDPYAIWVSEIMLQQTRVVTVVDYYRRWMARFPSVQALAEAPLESVLEAWAGLGYYRRARFLHEAAQTLARDAGGELPRTAKELRALKGVGPYTAGAIASFAFGEVTPIVDGNVARVLARLFALDVDPKDHAAQKTLWALAERLVDPEEPGAFNAAIMELGATICTPRSPSCLICPVRRACDAFASGDPAQFPRTAKRAKVRPVLARTCIVWRPGDDGSPEYLLCRRPLDGLLGGMWEFPNVTADPMQPDDVAVATLEAYLRDILGLHTGPARSLGEAVHLFSHLRMTFVVERRQATGVAEPCEPVGASGFEPPPMQWVGREAMAQVALSTAMRKVEALLDEPA